MPEAMTIAVALAKSADRACPQRETESGSRLPSPSLVQREHWDASHQAGATGRREGRKAPAGQCFRVRVIVSVVRLGSRAEIAARVRSVLRHVILQGELQ